MTGFVVTILGIGVLIGLAPRSPRNAEERSRGCSEASPILGSSFGTAIAGTILVAGPTRNAYAVAMSDGRTTGDA
ncbi:hypothetical protein [Embleya hyalina]|uniref:Uncharacterized protein n=1 Tax=Embleya hyalina TaxID=516124 RepID=A0A401Z1K5_9ACTN|nr:hypothetical protein [Embleya hyalina]GCE00750.1 hypothetical protein EHYA_08476 [Embleya hyalina]